MREYVERHYVPAATAYRERAAERDAPGARMASWRRMLDEAWPTLRFGATKIESDGERHVFEVEVDLGAIDPDGVSLELYAEDAEGTDNAPAEAVTMTCLRRERGPASHYVYSAQVPVTRPADDYTAWLIPRCPGVAVPLEAARILWQR